MKKFDEIAQLLLKLSKLLETQAQYLNNEEQTKQHLIDPVLQAVGWNLGDPAVVRREFAVDAKGMRRVDYAFFGDGDDTNPVLILEAKKVWGHKTSTDFKQLQEYLLNSRTRYASLTDGRTWQLYDKVGHSNGDVVRISSFCITDSDFDTIAKMLLLAPTNFFELRTCNKLPAVQPGLYSQFSNNKKQNESTERKSSEECCLLSNYHVDSSQSSSLPKKLVFGDGHEVQVSKWKDIPAGILAWLLSNSRVDIDNLPIMYSSNSQRAVVNIRPFHPDGRRWNQFEDILGVYLDTKYNNWAHVDNARKILDHAGVAHSEVTVVVA